MALGASVRIAGSTGHRVVPIDEFFVLPSEDVSKENILASDEIVTEILVPPARSGIASLYRKVRERGAWDFALTSVALVMITRKGGPIEEAAIVLGGVAPIPWRAEEAGAYLAGKTIDAETARESARLAVETAEPLAQNSFKIQLVRGVVESVLLGMT
jgi:xanthine dehydrogenase YagS FAD-binding subunit